MSADLVALVRRRPDVPAVADGVLALGERFELRGGETGPVGFHDPDGRLLVSVEEPTQVSVTGEIGRLLGPEFAERVIGPVWWVEIRAAADVPDAVRVARRFAEALVHWLGGTVYPDGGGPDTDVRSWRAADAAGVPPQQHQQFPGGVIG
ncbi:hypothetical protein [Actinomadura parmotrematis]|uniref:Uncharacterized protein n=1 Tax=Actinomadura parmotrematis TaxID=2864039 RepID=A0ABS7FYS3_9ACTN|nr:hypothetical protein [Actinomadura parmotrematis]MBW8485290.1 hypothetical protein [Actinomadura parmotrematis]